jgi:hypothetical protein
MPLSTVKPGFCLQMCLLGFHHCDQIPKGNNLKKKRFILRTVSEVSVHHGREVTVEKRSHCHGGQEAESAGHQRLRSGGSGFKSIPDK